MGEEFIPIADVKLTEDEINAAAEVLKSGYLRQGPKVKEFEDAFAKKVRAQYGIAVSSGTAALHIAYLALLEEGDEVLVPSFSHISTASMVCFTNCIPVFCDIDPRAFTLDLASAEEQLSSSTSAIVPVHLFGNAAPVDKVKDFAKKKDLRIIWDAAQAHGTKFNNRDVGSFGDLVTYSFYPTKNMTTGEGGMVTTNDEELYEKLKLLRSHGQTEKYYHPSLGLNYRMTDVEAAIGINQLQRLEAMNDKRKNHAEYLTEHLNEVAGIIPPKVGEEVDHSYHQYTILVDRSRFGMSRDGLKQKLEESGIGSAIHYPRPLHKQPIFEEKYGKVKLPNSESIAESILSLPVYPELNKNDLQAIVNAVKAVSQ